MTITLELNPALEANLRGQAEREGIGPDTLVLRTLEKQYGAAAMSTMAAAQEAELLRQINDGPPESTWLRYRDLSARRDAESLTSDEHRELINLSDAIEMSGVVRLERMAELAKLRGMSLRQLQSELGIPGTGETTHGG